MSEFKATRLVAIQKFHCKSQLSGDVSAVKFIIGMMNVKRSWRYIQQLIRCFCLAKKRWADLTNQFHLLLGFPVRLIAGLNYCRAPGQIQDAGRPVTLLDLYSEFMLE